MKRTLGIALFAVFQSFAVTQTNAQTHPDILVLGDSQVSSGTGAEYINFFSNLKQNCAKRGAHRRRIAKLGQQRTTVVGVRSTSLNSWVARDGRDKDTICAIDQNFGVNASVFGLNGQRGRKFVQIGQDAGVQYCRPNQSVFETVFSNPANNPKLLILAFLGNSADRWARNPRLADLDTQQTITQIPKDVSCILLTTAPVFLAETNSLRMDAQTNIVRSFKKFAPRCEIVKGMNARTRAAIEGDPQYFRRDADGNVADTLHPNRAAARKFVELNTSDLCDAVLNALK